MTSVVYATIEVEIKTDKLAMGIDMFHRWRRFAERSSNTKEYGVSITDWRIPARLREKKGVSE